MQPDEPPEESLTCSTCLQPIDVTSTTTCALAHIFCDSCVDSENLCPTCERLRNVRCMYIQIIDENFILPCKYFKKGCNFKGLPVIVEEHQEYCRYKRVNCPIRPSYRCPWRGSVTDVIQHCREVHWDADETDESSDYAIAEDQNCTMCVDHQSPRSVVGRIVCKECGTRCKSDSDTCKRVPNYTPHYHNGQRIEPCQFRHETCYFRGNELAEAPVEERCVYSPISCPLQETYTCFWEGPLHTVIEHCREDHRVLCRHKDKQCPLKTINNCAWILEKDKILAHCRKHHSDNVYCTPEQMLKWPHFGMLMPGFVQPDITYYMIFKAYGKLFKCLSYADMATGLVSWYMMYFGATTDASKYSFSISFENEDSIMEYRNSCQPFNHNIFETEDYFTTEIEILQEFCERSDLYYTVAIHIDESDLNSPDLLPSAKIPITPERSSYTEFYHPTLDNVRTDLEAVVNKLICDKSTTTPLVVTVV